MTSGKASSDLVRAVITGDLPAVKKLAESGLDCHGVFEHPLNTRRDTFLHFAAGSGKTDVVKYLIEEKGVDVNQLCAEGSSSLHRAAHFGFYEIVKLLVNNGADCNLLDKHEHLPCHWAAKAGHARVIKFLVKHGKADINKCNKLGTTPFHAAAGATKDLSFLKLLINLGANCTALDVNGNSALYYAGIFGQVNTVKFLIEEKHLDPNKCSKTGENLLHNVLFHSEEDTKSVLKDQVKVIEYLVKERKMNVNKVMNGGDTPLLMAFVHRDLSVVKLLIDSGADYNACDNAGNSPLHKAALLGKVDIVKYLIEDAKVDINKLNAKGETPLHIACLFGKLDCVKLLLDRGADINAVDEAGLSCMHFASINGGTDVVKYLAEEKNLDVNRGTKTGVTPLHSAACHGHLELCKLLVDLGANYVVRDMKGSSVLHFAAIKGHVDVLRYFIEDLGQDVNVCNYIFGATPLHCACSFDHLACVKLLLENGANCRLLDKKGNPCLNYAAKAPTKNVYWYLVREMKLKGDFGMLCEFPPLDMVMQGLALNPNNCTIS